MGLHPRGARGRSDGGRASLLPLAEHVAGRGGEGGRGEGGPGQASVHQTTEIEEILEYGASQPPAQETQPQGSVPNSNPHPSPMRR